MRKRVDLLFWVAYGKRAGDEALRDRGEVGGFNEVELGRRKRVCGDAEGADDGVDVVLFKKVLEGVDVRVVNLVSWRERLFARTRGLELVQPRVD